MNKLCRLCLRECKQDKSIVIVECRRYCPAPVQVEFKFKSLKKGARKRTGKGFGK